MKRPELELEEVHVSSAVDLPLEGPRPVAEASERSGWDWAGVPLEGGCIAVGRSLLWGSAARGPAGPSWNAMISASGRHRDSQRAGRSPLLGERVWVHADPVRAVNGGQEGN